MRTFTVFISLVLAICISARFAHADELQVLAIPEMLPVFQWIVPEFVRSSSTNVLVEYVSSRSIRERISAEEDVDLLFVTEDGWGPLVKKEKLEKPIEVASFGLGMGMRAGSLPPYVGDISGLQKALGKARRVGTISPTADAESARLQQLFQKHGFPQLLGAKLKIYTSALAITSALAKGELDYGFAPTMDLAQAGISFTSKLPKELENTQVISAALTTASVQEDAARAFVRFLRGPAAQQAFATAGLEPSLLLSSFSGPQSEAGGTRLRR